MTYQDAIKRLKVCGNECLDCIFCKEHDDAAEIAIIAMEKQVPKKPIAVINVDSEDTYRCPSCRATLMFRFQRATLASLCHHCVCGQALDWSNIE